MELLEKQLFLDNATMLCAKKVDMIAFNSHHLRKTGNPIAKLGAINSQGAAVFDADSAQGLKNKLFLSVGAKIVLTSNIWTEAKLVNGSQGTVEYSIYGEGKDPSKGLPDVVICSFPNYTGPSCIPGTEKLVPVVPLTVTWLAKQKQFSRTLYFPPYSRSK